MSAMNSYFKLRQDEEGVDIIIYPPKENGIRLKIDDVTRYLNRVSISSFDLKSLNDAITTCTAPVVVHLCDDEIYVVNECMDVIVSPDRMYAIGRFYAESNRGGSMTKEDILDELKLRGVRYGILEEVIDEYIKNPVYCTGIVLAKGTAPIEGYDAEITYNFQTDKRAKPHYNEDGTVDFHKLDNINNIKAGDILATLKPEYKGEEGMDVTGNKVLPHKVERKILRYGNNIMLSEDGLQIISKVDGHVTLEGDRVFVSNVYDVGADVDATTGDIDYNGSVEVKGNVRTGFKIKAEGNIEIRGVVEGAEIIAKGDIILHRGVQGMGKAVLIAGGNIVSKFIESANVASGGYIETDSILHSNVSAKNDVRVCGKNGSIIGGSVRATNSIEASIVGSSMGTATVVEVGCDPGLQDSINGYKQTIKEKTEEKEKLTQLITLLKHKQQTGELDNVKMNTLINAAKSLKSTIEIIEKNTALYEDAIAQLESNAYAKISITRDIFAGAKVVISGDYILIHDSISHCKYMKQHGEIKAIPL